MAKLPRDLDGWSAALRSGWPRKALPADASRGLETLVRLYLRADSAGRKRVRIAAREPIEDRLWSFAHLAAGKLRVDYRRVFEGAREYGGRGYAELVQDWLERIEFERAISEMGYKEATGGKRFRYVDDEDGGNA